MPYEVIIKPAALKSLRKIPKEHQLRIRAAIDLLSSNPYPPRSKKLIDRPGHRIRVGDYRIIYEINNNELLIIIIKVGHRKNVYED